MVYCGPPSASCALCRVKKRRCDKATPACGHCRRTGKTCPGYRDASSLVFRDQTTRVIDRARTVKAHRMASAQSLPPFEPLSLTGSPALAALPDDTASSLTHNVSENNQEEHEDEGDSGGEGNSGRDRGKDGKNVKVREDERNEDDITDNVVDEDQPFVSDEMDLFISDESMSREPGRLGHPSSSSPVRSRPPSRDLNDVMSMLITPAAPSESLHELGISYFLSNYVVQNSGPCPGFLNYTLDILVDPLGDTELVQVAIRAAGLAGLASTTGSHNIMSKALTSYTEAITRVNAALADSRMTSNDSTIFAVIILGLFETITCSGNESLEAWKNHIIGAANLLMHRGTAQFLTKRGIHLFGEALSHVLTLCSRYNQPLPTPLRLLRVELEPKFAGKSVAWGLSSAHIEVMELCYRVDPDQKTPFLHDEWKNLLSHAAELDRRLENLVVELPLQWRFKTVIDPGANPRVVYHSTYHIYYNTWVAKVYDGIRACRILLNQAIYSLLTREGVAWAPYELSLDEGVYTSLLQRASDTTIEMSDGILASVPQMLGFVYHEPAIGISYLHCNNAGASGLVPASGAYFLLWHLFLAGTLPINTLETRAWIVDRLYAIRSATGILKAGYLADTLKTNSAFLDATLSTSEFLIPDFEKA